MANGDITEKIECLLSEKEIGTPAAMRLMLELQTQTFRKLDDFTNKQKTIEDRLKRVEDSSIVLWIQKNPKLTVVIVTVYLVVSSFVDWREIAARVLGVE